MRALRLHRETGGGVAAGGAEDSVDAARALRRSARRISAGLHTFRPLLDADWSERIRPELAWVSGTLALEHACGARLERLLLALHRLSGAAAAPVPARVGVPTQAGPAVPAASPAPAAPAPASGRGNLTVGAAKAGALLDRQLTLARTRAHSTALQALGSSRFHAVADQVAVLASEVPLTPAASTTDLRPLAAAAQERLADAVAALPLVTAGSPYNAEALVHGLSPDPAPHPQDTPWHQVRLLLRLHRYACEVLDGGPGTPVDVRLLAAGQALDRHRDAAEAASAAAQAARTPRIAPATAYALGVLHADQRHEVEAARYAFQRSWPKRNQ
ncbi:CHAD domain-containing protein [Streptomyces antibioticus]